MAVNAELLCSFELLKPLDSTALKNHIKKGRKERLNTLNSPVSCSFYRIIAPANTSYSLQINTLRVTDQITFCWLGWEGKMCRFTSSLCFYLRTRMCRGFRLAAC